MPNFDPRQLALLIMFFFSSTVLIYKLAQLQIFDDTYKRLAQRTILDKQIIYPSRGNIYDRNGKLLTYNKPIYDLQSIFKNVDPKMDTTLFCSLLDIKKSSFPSLLNKNWKDQRFHKSLPFTFISKINPIQYSSFQEHLFRFPGFYPVVRNIRAYPHTNAPHLLGYLSEVNIDEVNKENSEYQSGDFVGKNGLEKKYEHLLRGDKGIKFLVRDNLGREVSSFNSGKLDSISNEGVDLHTTIDLDLQAYCELLMSNKRGSIVAIEPSTGEILSMVSSPGYDPNLLNLDEDRSKAFKALWTDKIQRPLLDRSIAAKYPPGSIFKPILSLIALQEGVFYPNKTVSCNGYYEYRTFKFGCHQHSTPYTIKSAIMHSCNSYFFEMVRKLIEKEGYNKPGVGLNILKGHLTDFGLGKELGIDLPNENTGFVPDPAYYDHLYRNAGAKWKSTYIMSIGIGQGELDLTTVQMANLAAIIANRGYYITPHLVKRFSDPSMSISDQYTAKRLVRIDKEHFKPVIDGMRMAITQGTGYKAHVNGIDICGKTGTSQNPHGDDHSVFFAFAPKDDPKIALAVYVENAGFGGDIAAPIAGLVVEKYINKKVRRPILEENMINIDLISKDLPPEQKKEAIEDNEHSSDQ